MIYKAQDLLLYSNKQKSDLVPKYRIIISISAVVNHYRLLELNYTYELHIIHYY